MFHLVYNHDQDTLIILRSIMHYFKYFSSNCSLQVLHRAMRVLNSPHTQMPVPRLPHLHMPRQAAQRLEEGSGQGQQLEVFWDICLAEAAIGTTTEAGAGEMVVAGDGEMVVAGPIEAGDGEMVEAGATHGVRPTIIITIMAPIMAPITPALSSAPPARHPAHQDLQVAAQPRDLVELQEDRVEHFDLFTILQQLSNLNTRSINMESHFPKTAYYPDETYKRLLFFTL